MKLGLLGQGWDDPRSSAVMALAGGLLKGDMGGGLLGANDAYGQAKQNAFKQQLLQAQLQETQAQAQERQIRAQREQQELQRQAAIRTALPGLFRQPGMTGGEAVPQTQGGVPMFSQPMGVSPMQQTPGGFDVQKAIQLGMTPEQITAYAGLSNVGRPKATRQMEVDDGRGGKRIALVDDFGQEVAGFAGYTAPVQVNQGDRVTFAKPAPGVSLPVNMSPDARASNALGWANHGLGKQRLALDATNAQAGKVPPGYRVAADGRSLEAIPGGPADLKAGAEGVKRTTDAKDVLALLDEVDTLLPRATGSYLGAGYDMFSAAFGDSTKGAEATAQLKALQGALIGKMPKMSGPQSDKDVQLYREMAGQVGDPTIPVPQRQAAAAMIRRLNEKYAGMPEGSSKKTRSASGKVGGVTFLGFE